MLFLRAHAWAASKPPRWAPDRRKRPRTQSAGSRTTGVHGLVRGLQIACRGPRAPGAKSGHVTAPRAVGCQQSQTAMAAAGRPSRVVAWEPLISSQQLPRWERPPAANPRPALYSRTEAAASTQSNSCVTGRQISARCHCRARAPNGAWLAITSSSARMPARAGHHRSPGSAPAPQHGDRGRRNRCPRARPGSVRRPSPRPPPRPAA